MNATDPNVYATLDGLIRLRSKARGFSFLPRQPLASLLAGRFASKVRGRGLNFEEVRRYRPGDDVRQIDWKVTARTRKAHSRVYTEERERPNLLVVDQRVTMFFGSRVRMKSVVAAEAAALAAWRAVGVRDRVGAVVFSDADIAVVRPQRSRAAVMRTLNAVVERNRRLSADPTLRPNPAMLNAALERASRLATHDALVVLITDAAGADATTSRLVTEIARHNVVVVVFVFDALEADLPTAGGLVVGDGERQMELDAGGGLRRDFAREFTERREAAKHFLIVRDAPVLPLDTERDVVDQILHGMGVRPQGHP